MEQQLVQTFKASDILQRCIDLGYKRITGRVSDDSGGVCAIGGIVKYVYDFGLVNRQNAGQFTKAITAASNVFESHYRYSMGFYSDRTNADWEGLVRMLRDIGQ
jgi:hypothetical protein